MNDTSILVADKISYIYISVKSEEERNMQRKDLRTGKHKESKGREEDFLEVSSCNLNVSFFSLFGTKLRKCIHKMYYYESKTSRNSE